MTARLTDFICTALRYAERSDDRSAQRLLDSPYSSVARADARAYATLASERETLVEAMRAKRVRLSAEASQQANTFASFLERLSAAGRAPQLTAGEVVSLSVTALRSTMTLDAAENSLLAAIQAQAESLGAGVSLQAAADAIEGVQRKSANGSVHDVSSRESSLSLVVHEAPRRVSLRVRHFSASSLEMFAECRRKWFYRYACSSIPDSGSAASFYGTAFHYALENFHGEVVRIEPGTAREPLETKLIAWVNAAFERHRANFPSVVEYELQRRRARRTARRYLDWLFVRARQAPFEIIGNEVEVQLELEGLQFIGFVDRLDRDIRTGAVTVIDYKTGQIAEHGAAYRDEIARFVEFQLPFYYWSVAATGERVTRLALVPLRDGYGEIMPVELEVLPVPAPRSNPRDRSASATIGIDELERARAKMIEIASLLRSERFDRFPPAATSEPCFYCAYAKACRERPAPEPARFAR